MVVVRGDHRVNEIKLGARSAAPWRAATAEEIASADRAARVHRTGRRRHAGSPRRRRGADGLLRRAARTAPTRTCAGVQPGRDFAFERVDVRSVESRRPRRRRTRSRSSRRSRWATSSSSARATRRRSAPRYLDEQGAEQLIWMGSYGIGMARIAAAAVEQFADEHGISWPAAIAPFHVHLVVLGEAGSAERELAEARLRGAARGRDRRHLRRPRCGGRREVRRRRAAGRAAAAHRRPQGARSRARSRCSSAVGGRRRPGIAPGERARAGGGAVRATCPERPPAARARPLRPAAAADRARRAAAAVDDPQRHRLRARRADPGVPDPRVPLGARHRRRGRRLLLPRRRRRLRRRHRGADHRSVQPARGAARPGRRPRCSCSPGSAVCWSYELLPRWLLARRARARGADARARPGVGPARACRCGSTGRGGSPSGRRCSASGSRCSACAASARGFSYAGDRTGARRDRRLRSRRAASSAESQAQLDLRVAPLYSPNPWPRTERPQWMTPSPISARSPTRS